MEAEVERKRLLRVVRGQLESELFLGGKWLPISVEVGGKVKDLQLGTKQAKSSPAGAAGAEGADAAGAGAAGVGAARVGAAGAEQGLRVK